MSGSALVQSRADATRVSGHGHPAAALGAALLGFFVITLDALVVNVALPAIRTDRGGGITGLQWVLDGYTLMFAALRLSAGSLSAVSSGQNDRTLPGFRGSQCQHTTVGGVGGRVLALRHVNRLKVVRGMHEGLEDDQVFVLIKDEHGVGREIRTNHCDSRSRHAATKINGV